MSGREAASASSARTAWAGRRCAACWRDSTFRRRARSRGVTPAALRVSYLPQQPERRRDETVLDFLRRRSGVAAAETELQRASDALAVESRDSEDVYAA